jgi:hypothetical protein
VAGIICLPVLAQESPRPVGGGLADRFRQLDRNGDGKVSAEGFPDPLFRLPIPVPAVLDSVP